LKFNPLKSQVAVFGCPVPNSCQIFLGTSEISWCERVKYLGCYFNCRTADIDVSPCLSKFYGSFNSILSALGCKGNEMLSVFMVRQYCLPSMMYGSEIWYINDNNLRSLDTAWNNAFRKIFNGFWRENVKPLLFYCKCLPITFLANLNKLLFWKKLMVFDNPIVRWLATRRKDNMDALACKMNIDCDLMVTSRREVKSKVWHAEF